MNNTWKKTKGPGGGTLWIPKEGGLSVPDAHVEGKSSPPIMLTSDMALKKDPEYNKIAQRFLNDPKEFERAFAKAWFKLTHRDMGPRSRYVGKDAPKDIMLWQDPVPAVNYKLISSAMVEKLKSQLLNSGLSISEMVKLSWAAASSYRNTDMRGGANGARVRLAPQKDWLVNDPDQLGKALAKVEEVQKDFNSSLSGGQKVSLADTIVLAGAAAIESAAKKAGASLKVPFVPGRTDANQDQTDVASFASLELKADAFRNYYSSESLLSPAKMMVDRASLLGLSVPEMVVLIGGMRVLGANSQDSRQGYFTDRLGTLSNDFFVNLLDMSTLWKKSSTDDKVYEGIDRQSEAVKWTASPIDLIIGSHSELRAIAEVYAADDAQEKFLKDFAKAWSGVMQNDRFDIK